MIPIPKPQKPLAHHETYYVDASFPPGRVSLLGQPGLPSKLPTGKSLAWEKYTWLHWSHLKAPKITTIASSISALQITQGQIGNCCFVSTLVALALVPQRIKRLFLSDKLNAGHFELTVYPMGIPTKTKLDGYFPYSKEYESLAFTRSQTGELWPMLLEKAWAKYLGSYQDINGKPACFAFTFLSRFPAVTLDHQKIGEDALWKALLEAQANKFPMTGSSLSSTAFEKENKVTEYEALGLVPSHGYTILGVKEEEGTKRIQRLVCLRNPWGKLEWVGNVGTESNILPSYVEKKVAGQFFISFEAFYKLFSSVTICKYHESYSQITVQLEIKSDLMEHLVSIDVKEPCNAYFQVNEDFRRQPVLCGILIGYQNPSNGSWEYIDTQRTLQYNPFIECNLEKPGRYCYFLQICDGLKERHDILTLTICSSRKVRVKTIADTEFKVKFIRSTLRSCAVKKGRRTQLAPGIYQYDNYSVTGVYYASLFYLNFSKDTTLYHDVNYENKESVELFPPFEGLSRYKLILPPKQERDVFMRIPKGAHSSSYTSIALFDKPRNVLLEEVKAKLLPVSKSISIADNCEFGYKVYGYDLGYVLEYTNYSKNKVFIGRFEFELHNLKFEEGNGFTIELQPGTTLYKLAHVVDPFNHQTRYTVKYRYDCKTLGRTETELIKLLKENGDKKRLSGECAWMWSSYIEGDYCLFVSNDSDKALEFKLTFKKPRNLECKDGDNWEMVLRRADKSALKVVKRTKPFEPTECGYNISYIFRQCNKQYCKAMKQQSVAMELWNDKNDNKRQNQPQNGEREKGKANSQGSILFQASIMRLAKYRIYTTEEQRKKGTGHGQRINSYKLMRNTTFSMESKGPLTFVRLQAVGHKSSPNDFLIKEYEGLKQTCESQQSTCRRWPLQQGCTLFKETQPLRKQWSGCQKSLADIKPSQQSVMAPQMVLLQT
eukprot:TRINITY_DN88609_c0_g1_i1.p1 TRINITY_DN88609_c0_g1~~TRINITY_DN88609_c0_g1_i1.p1  ORF type:complete len:944 (+),score=26.90 TRINITY_DN88609_c0_g1_i1:93-2924(+)